MLIGLIYAVGLLFTIFVDRVVTTGFQPKTKLNHILILITIWLLSPILILGLVMVTIGYLIETKICRRR